MSTWDKILNYISPDAPETQEEKLDAILKNQTGGGGFAAPSSKTRRVRLSGGTRSQKLSRAQQSKALGFDLAEVQSATQRVLQSQNPVVKDVITRAGGRTPAGPTLRLDRTAQSIPLPTPRPKPAPTPPSKTKMV